LGPVFDEDDLEITEVDWYEALCHFTMIGWKVLFALVPPAGLWNGFPSFVISLVFIALVTGIVGEVATVLGCVLNIK